MTCGLILLPLNPNKRYIENHLQKFLEKIKLYDPLQHVDLDITKNVAKIQNSEHDSELKQGFMASYLRSFPFLKRLSIETITGLLQRSQLKL